MGLFDRLTRLFKANANAALDQIEDPSIMLEQVIRESEEAIAKSKHAVAKTIALHKKNEELYQKSLQDKEIWTNRAKLALSKGDENLAREAATYITTYTQSTNTAYQTMQMSAAQVEKVKAQLELQEKALQKAKAEKANLIARFELAKASKQIDSLISEDSLSATSTAFDNLRDTILSLEAEVELNTDSSAESFRALEQQSMQDDVLLQLKAQFEQEEQLKIAAQLDEQIALLPSSPPKHRDEDLFDSDFFK